MVVAWSSVQFGFSINIRTLASEALVKESHHVNTAADPEAYIFDQLRLTLGLK